VQIALISANTTEQGDRRMENDDLIKLKEVLLKPREENRGVSITVQWGALLGILSSILIVSLGYLFVLSVSLQTRVSVMEQTMTHFSQTIERLASIDKEQGNLLRDLREERMRRGGKP
jgi:hypothetical protein